jgi:hypothetical protein
MVICLAEIEDSAYKSVPTLFRSVAANGIGQFHGIIVWCPSAHALELAPNAELWRDKKKMTIQWASYKKNKSGQVVGLEESMKGTEQDAQECIEKMTQFIKLYGGPHSEQQWAADGINNFSIDLFSAAIDLWGYPKLIDRMK